MIHINYALNARRSQEFLDTQVSVYVFCGLNLSAIIYLPWYYYTYKYSLIKIMHSIIVLNCVHIGENVNTT